MKRTLILALAATFAASAFAQTNPKDILAKVNKFEEDSYQQLMKDSKATSFQKINDQVHQMIGDSLKDVDPSKVDPKDAYDWAQLYSRLDDHKTVCDLTHLFLTSNPTPEEKFKDQMLMMSSCNELGEADMLKETLVSTQPVSSHDKVQLAMSATRYVDTIAGKKGDEDGLKLLDKLQKEIQLPDPKDAAKQRLEMDKNEKKDSAAPGTTPALPLSGTSTPALTDDQKLALYEEQAKNQNDSVRFGFASERAKLLQDEGKKTEAIAILTDFAKDNPSLGKGTQHMLDMTTAQISITGSPEIELKADKTVGSFSGLDSLKGKVVLLDFFAHWCGPCMASVPSMVSMYGELHSQGLEIVGATSFYGYFAGERNLPPDQEFSKLQGLLTEKNMTWPIVVGPKDNGKAYGVWGIPETVLIDKKGVIRNIWVGYTPSQEAVVKKAVEKLLQE